MSFHYGLPTANLVGGFTVEGTDLFGFDFYGEWNRNVRYSQYPNTFRFSANKGHEISSRNAEASLLTISRQAYPYFAFAELYSIDEDYSTSAFVSDSQGDFKYDQPVTVLYEFVDDNATTLAGADWSRAGGGGTDTQVYPGWDENWDSSLISPERCRRHSEQDSRLRRAVSASRCGRPEFLSASI